MQLLISTVGAAVGFAIGGPAGAQVGWAAGSLIGGALGPTQQGPRLSDTTVQVSSFGVPPGIVWGRTRKAGNVIWSTPLKERRKRGDSKKGQPDTFSYSVSCAVGICEGVQGGIRRIWADSKLVFDGREEASAKAKAASSAFRKYFTFYPGDETQMPDPTIEAKEGVGNVPGYRGLCYVVFTDLPLAKYGNRIPNFSFELSGEGEQPSQVEYIAGARVNRWTVDGGMPSHFDGITEYTPFSSSGTPGPTTTSIDEAIASLGILDPLRGTYVGFWTDVTEVLDVYGYDTGLNSGNGAYFVYLAFNVSTPDVAIADGLTYPGGLDACYQLSLKQVSVNDGRKYMFSSYQQGRGGLLRLVSFGTPVPGYGVANNCTNYPPGSGGYYPQVLHSPNAVIMARRVPTYPVKMCVPGIPTPDAPAEMPGDSGTCVFFDGSIAPQVNFTVTTGSFLTLKDFAAPGNVITQLPLGPTIRASDPRATDAAFWNAAAAAAGLSETYNPPFLPKATSVAAVGLSQQTSVPEGSVLLSKIVRDICLLAGLRADQIDVSQLTEIVAGYQVSRESSARAAIEQLRQAFWFDAVESGEVIRFVKRGGAPVAQLTFDDLGAGEEQSVEPVEPTRMQETELPASLSVVYAAGGADYQTGTQTERRMATVSQQHTTLQLAITMDDQQAADAAAVLMYDAWTSRTERSISVLRSWAHLEPTDVITVHDGEFACTVRIVDKSEAGPIIKLLTRDEDAASYSPAAHATPTPGGGSTVRLDGPTRLEVLDIPLLRQADDSYGIYAAAVGYLDDWRGAVLYRTPAGGASPSAVGTFDTPTTMGYARTVLGGFTGGNVVDEGNSVDVQLHPSSDQIESITYAELLNNGNLAVLGDEVLQFRSATLIAPRTYRLTGLLRGRLGTEHQMAAHAINERFVLLDSEALLRVGDAIATRGAEQAYRAVTIGLGIDDAYDQPAVNTGASQKPLSPVHLSAQPVPGGGYLARWVRRTRYGGAWLDTTDVPLGEASESYVVRVIDGSTVVEEQTVTSPTATLGVSASGYSLVPVMQLGSQIWAAKEVGGDLFGLRVDNVDSNAKRVIKLNAAGSLVAQSSGMGQQVFQAVHGTTSIYVITTDPLNPTLYRFAYSDISSPAATRSSALASDFGGVAFDGTNVWLAERSTNLLHRCDASTLATVASYAFDWDGDAPNTIYADGGYIWAVVGADIVKWDTTAESEVDRVTTGSTELADIVLSTTMVFAIFQAATPRVEVYDRATLTLQATHSAAPFAPTYPGHYGLVHDGLVYVGDTARAVNLFSASTGASLGQAALDVSGTDMAGVFGGRVVVSGSPTNNYLNITSSTYELGAPVAASDYSGMTLTVQQVSDTVGPGFPASITL